MAKRQRKLSRLLAFGREKGSVNNRDVRRRLRIGQSTATDYLHELVAQGSLKREGIGKETTYSIAL